MNSRLPGEEQDGVGEAVEGEIGIVVYYPNPVG